MEGTGRIDQGGGNRNVSGSQDWSQPQFGVPKADLRNQIDSLDNLVIVGTKQGKPFIASTEDDMKARDLLREHASELFPQTA